jgi:hypothetical protein
MKKIYIQPTTKVVEIKVQAILQAWSAKSEGLDEPITGGDEEGNAEDEGV